MTFKFNSFAAAISIEPPPINGEITFLILLGKCSNINPTAKDLPPPYLKVDPLYLLYPLSDFNDFKKLFYFQLKNSSIIF